MTSAPFIVQIALFAAAGASFVAAHLKNITAQRQVGEKTPPIDRWRNWRHPHLRPREARSADGLKQASLLRSIWGFGFLALGFLTPFAFHYFHIGP